MTRILCFLEFREGKTAILVATDVASRGLGKWLSSSVSYLIGVFIFCYRFITVN